MYTSDVCHHAEAALSDRTDESKASKLRGRWSERPQNHRAAFSRRL